MAFDSNRKTVERSGTHDASIDLGLRAYMLKIYNYMFVALGITGVVSYYTAQSESLLTLLHGGFKWVLFIGILAMAFMLPSRIYKMKTSTAQLLFWTFSILIGLMMSYIFLLYTGTSIVRTFFITAATFGAMSLYGYTTKRDLTGMGSFLYMALIGLIISSVVNIFMQSSLMYYITSFAGVLIFTGLTAYDTQKMKDMYHGDDSQGIVERKAILGAFVLYLDFINLFMYLMRFFGDRK